jgi:hypothetical protein
VADFWLSESLAFGVGLWHPFPEKPGACDPCLLIGYIGYSGHLFAPWGGAFGGFATDNIRSCHNRLLCSGYNHHSLGKGKEI